MICLLLGFDDGLWSEGNAPFRYGDGVGGTLLSDMQYNYSVVYMRTTFHATHTDSLESVWCSIDYDDGFVVWINGKKVLSKNAPVVPAYNGFSTDLRESGSLEAYLLAPETIELIEGENVLAIQGFNTGLESTDFFVDLGLHAEVKVPVFIDSTGLTFSVPSGFYEDTFLLDIRASSVISGIKPSVPESRTYIFLNKVLTQSHPFGGWPIASINEQEIDLKMDSRIVIAEAYKDQMIPSLISIPSISIITDLEYLFHPQTGIYVNAGEHGFAWERECSVELINSDSSDGFNVNAGLRIRGGWSRHPDYPKHAFRLFFRSEYGDAKLNFPLFGDEGVDQFDKVDLRTAQNYAWSNGDGRNTFLQDVFSRDTQRDMGQPYTRSRYYHLYLNGMYWGLYQTQERSIQVWNRLFWREE